MDRRLPRPSATQLRPALRASVWVFAVFALSVVLVEAYEAPLERQLAAHGGWALVVFGASSVLAVLVPVLSNLALLPLAVLAWGPWGAAALLLAGWVLGSMLAFLLGRQARAAVLARFVAVQRHADIDRLIDPRHRLASLVLLRLTFPVDVLSYALGLFSRGTRLHEVALSTALGAAPFAVLFAWAPALPPAWGYGLLAASAVVFVAYAAWMLGRSA
jgi:uncharacterized membrane protein YdjX (TVP38/TMEM64 family)